MKFLLDTCVISELIKPKPDKNVAAWIQSQNEHSLYLSVLTFGEIQKGIEKTTDTIRIQRLKSWVDEDLYIRFKSRIIPIDLTVANKWGEIQAQTEKKGTPMPAIDGLIAVSGLVYNCTVVTRNISDMKNSTALLLNPWL